MKTDPSVQMNELTGLLAACHLPFEDLTGAHLPHFQVIWEGSRLVAAGGLEIYDTVALLRSLAVAETHRGRHLGSQIVAKLEQYARKNGVEEVYLLTTTAAGFFAKHGYRKIAREAVPAAIRQTREFAHICPASAVCMGKQLRANPPEKAAS